MEISGVSPASHSLPAIQLRDNDHATREVQTGAKRGHEISQGAALHAFRAELRSSLIAKFNAVFGAAQPDYSAGAESLGADEVADEAVAVAKSIAARSPQRTPESMIRFRSSVEESVQIASRTVQTPADQADLDQAVARIDSGVAELEADAAATRESSASVLNVDTSTQQKSMIKIRTQEGDLVRLSLRQASEMSASSAELAEGDSFAQSLQIDYSSSSRLAVMVRGDLNEAEMGAIESVLAQAQEMADAFFGGDIGAAFASASSFEFDTEQLARVKMRFKMQQESEVSYAQASRIEVAPAEVEAAEPAEVSEPLAAEVQEQEVQAAEVAAEPEVAPEPVPDDAMQGFFEMVGNFLRSVSEGFTDGGGIRYQYTESFKLSLLQSVINTAAPSEAESAKDGAIALIDHMGDAQDV